MKQAFLIGAYCNPTYLEELIESLRNPYCNIYIHINKYFDSDFYELRKKYLNTQDVTFVTSHKMLYGSSTIMSMERELLLEALKDEDNARFHLITGQDLLVRPINDLISFFESDENKDKEFISYSDYSYNWDKWGRRFFYYHLHDLFDCRDTRWTHRLDFQFSKLQRLLHVHRSPLPFEKVYYGSGWWSVSRMGANAILEAINDEKMMKRFKYTFGCDEVLPLSVLLNNKKLIVINNNYRYIVFGGKSSSPNILQEKDIPDIEKSEAFFVRKIHPIISKQLIQYYHNK